MQGWRGNARFLLKCTHSYFSDANVLLLFFFFTKVNVQMGVKKTDPEQFESIIAAINGITMIMSLA